jgi:flagella basal body P-ring formation protein FlgA
MAAKSELQSHSSIRDAARNFLLQRSASTSGSVEVDVKRLDARLRLQRCDRALEAFLPASGKTSGRVTVGVRCNGGKPWSLYLPARVKRLETVVIAKHELMRGQPLRRSDLTLEQHDVGRLRRGYFVDLQRVIGQIPERNLPRGRVLSPKQLKAPDAIARGSEVSIVASIHGIQARMKGLALDNGALGERIRVKNLSSNKELEARITSAGTVQVDI